MRNIFTQGLLIPTSTVVGKLTMDNLIKLRCYNGVRFLAFVYRIRGSIPASGSLVEGRYLIVSIG